MYQAVMLQYRHPSIHGKRKGVHMENTPVIPPAPATRSRKGLWIGLGAGIFLVVVLAVTVVVLWPHFPKIFRGVPISYQLYENKAAGLSFYYPPGWAYSDESYSGTNQAMFASSPELLDYSSAPLLNGGAVFVLMSGDASGYIQEINSTADTFMNDYIAEIAGSFSPLGQVREFKISGFPAVSQSFTGTEDYDSTNTYHIVISLRDEKDMVLFIFACLSSDWEQYKPVFNNIVRSMSLVSISK